MTDANNTNQQVQTSCPPTGVLTETSTQKKEDFNLPLEQARRTAFVARFIVLREGKRTKAHRVIEQMTWKLETTAEELYVRFRQAFLDNQDNMMPVDRDLRRAYKHAEKTHMVGHFVEEYQERAALSFIQALYDYERSNTLLFGQDEQPRSGGWRLPKELEREKQKLAQ